jgi:hypothetical protein
MTATPGTASWKRVAAQVVVWLGVSFGSWYAALWLFPLPPQGTFTGAAAEGVNRAYTLWWWKSFALYIVACVLVYEVAPRLWPRGAHGEVAR